MSENIIDSQSSSKPTADTPKPKGKRKSAKKAKPAKKPARAKKRASQAKTDRTNKKADVIAMMKRAKGATLPEIMKATDWQPHTIRWLRQHPRQQRRGNDRLVQERRGRTNIQDREIAGGNSSSKCRLGPCARGGVPASGRK